MLDLKGNLFTDATFADAAPLTPRTPSTIKVLLNVFECSFKAVFLESLVSGALTFLKLGSLLSLNQAEFERRQMDKVANREVSHQMKKNHLFMECISIIQLML